MPPAEARRQLRRTARRDALVLDAARVFAERGYEQTSVPELAERLEMGVGSLYHYFGSKEQLLIEICDQLMHPLLERAEGADGLRDLVHLWVEHVIAHRDHMLVFQQVRHLVDSGPRWREVRRSRKRFEVLLDERLAFAAAVGDLAGESRSLALRALLGMVNHTAQWYRPRGALSAAAIADGYLALISRPGASAPSPGTSARL